MKIYVLTLLAFLCLLLSASAQDEYVFNQKANLNIRAVFKANKIKYANIYILKGNDDQEKIFASRVSFNQNGLPEKDSSVGEEIFDTGGNILVKGFVYNEKGFLTETNLLQNDNSLPLEYYSYDDKGNLDGGSTYGAEPRRYVFTYDSKNHLSKKVGWTVFTPEDSTGEVIQVWNIVDSSLYEFNDAGFLVKETQLGFGNPVTINYKYNEKGLITWIGMKVPENEDYRLTVEYTYDKNGLLIKGVENSDINGVQTRIIEYEKY